MSDEQVQQEPIHKRVKKALAPKVRKHRIDNINRNNLAKTLDDLHAAGWAILAMNISRDIGGTYEVVSYKEEAVPETAE